MNLYWASIFSLSCAIKPILSKRQIHVINWWRISLFIQTSDEMNFRSSFCFSHLSLEFLHIFLFTKRHVCCYSLKKYECLRGKRHFLWVKEKKILRHVTCLLFVAYSPNPSYPFILHPLPHSLYFFLLFSSQKNATKQKRENAEVDVK